MVTAHILAHMKIIYAILPADDQKRSWCNHQCILFGSFSAFAKNSHIQWDKSLLARIYRILAHGIRRYGRPGPSCVPRPDQDRYARPLGHYRRIYCRLGPLSMDITARSSGVFAAMFEKEKSGLYPWAIDQDANFYAPHRPRVSILQNHKLLLPQIRLECEYLEHDPTSKDHLSGNGLVDGGLSE